MYFNKIGGNNMFYLGKKVKYFDNDVVVLTWLDNEVLIFIEEDNVKWVDKSLLEFEYVH